MYELDHPHYFYLLLAIPAVILLYLIYVAWRRRTRRRFGDPAMLQRLSPEHSSVKAILKLVLGLLIIAALSIALVNPRIGTRLENVKRQGVDIVFAIDVSKSMLAEDVQPNRMQKAKQLVSRILDVLVSDRVGMIIYAARAYPQLPITTDYNAARLFLKTVDTDLIPSQGTAIAEAIEMAVDYYDDKEQKNRVLIIISDGEDHEKGYEQAVEEARKQGISIYTIGVGTTQGAPIPDFRRGKRIGYKRAGNGEVVISRLHTDVLKEIAREANGEYIDGSNSRQVAEFFSSTIAEMEKKEFETQIFADYEDQFQWFLGIALLLLVLDAIILDRRTQWFKKLNLFGEEDEKDNN